MSARSTAWRRGRGEVGLGLLLLGLLWAIALAAPLLAGSRPLLQVSGGAVYFPALAGQAPEPKPTDLRVLPPLPHDPVTTSLPHSLRPPGREHPLGTDRLGRDVASRIVHGARTSLLVGGLGTVLALALGLCLGGVAGYYGGRADRAVVWLIDVALCFPSLLLAIALVAVTGIRGAFGLAVILAATRWARIARYARAEFLRFRSSALVGAARAAGASDLRILAGHILPNALAPIGVTAAFTAAGAILLEAGLGFLGLGVPPPAPSWGGILAEARLAGAAAWWLAVFPGVMIFLALGAYSLLGEGLLERLDPRREAARSGGTPARGNAL